MKEKEEPKNNNIQYVKSTIEQILGTDTILKRKRKNKNDKLKVLFNYIINGLEALDTRTALLQEDWAMDLTKYDEPFYGVIDSLIELHFGKESMDLIHFYVYDRINPDGSPNIISDSKGNIIPLNNPDDLWILIENIINNKIK